MEAKSERFPLSTLTFIFGTISIPLAFLRHLCSLAVVVGMLAITFSLWGHWYARRHPDQYSIKSRKYMRFGGYAASVGTAAAIVMWVLYARNILLN
ncbi:MAG: hypothetical protein M3R08_05050 [Bacteroidota bacterium]|nr:hypothetical protein [Bacteroidota bacterium]